MLRRALQHLHAAHFGFKERDNRPRVGEATPDLFHVLILHSYTVEDKIWRVVADDGFINEHIDHHAAHGDAKIVKPGDKALDDGDRQRLRQGDEKEGGLGIVGQ